jgi:hypothetical protein
VTGSASVFLVGCQRSGTTALASALNLAYASEGRVFTVNGKLPYLLDRWLRQSDVDARHLRDDEIRHALARRLPYGVGVSEWLDRAEAALTAAAQEIAAARTPAPDRNEIVRRIVARAYGGRTGWGDKYNEYLLDPGCLYPFRDTARVVLVVRDPAEVAASMLSWRPRRGWCPQTEPAAQAKWVAWHRQFLAHPLTAELPLLVVDYADMWRPPVLRQVEQFCQLETPVEPLRRTTPARTALPPATDEASALWVRLRDMQQRVTVEIGQRNAGR